MKEVTIMHTIMRIHSVVLLHYAQTTEIEGIIIRKINYFATDQ